MTIASDFCCDRMKFDLEQTCEQHLDRFECPDNLIAKVRGGFGLIVHDGTGSAVEISFCPWCGTALPPIGALDLSGELDV